MKQTYFLLILLMGAFFSQAQTAKAKISGTVIDGSQKTIESATIALVRVRDSSTVKFSVADKNSIS